MHLKTLKESYAINGALGLGIVGAGFGIARYGYGLFLPQAQQSFELKPLLQGAIASGSYATYLGATLVAAYLSHIRGPRIPVLMGLFFAFIGALLVYFASTAWVFALGIIIAGASPGFIFPALSDWSIINGRDMPDRLFAIMNSGTGAGVIVATPFALFTINGNWQVSWLLFAVLIMLLCVFSSYIVPNKTNSLAINNISDGRLSYLTIAGSLPLYICALVSGLTTSVYWTYSVSLVSTYEDELSSFSRPEIVFWLITGVSGFLGALAGDAVIRLGVVSSYKLTMIAITISLVSITAPYGGILVILFSSFLFGSSFIFITGILSVWTMRVFVSTPSIGIGYTFLIFTLGAMLGPFLGGFIIELTGYKDMFIAFAVVAFIPTIVPASILYKKNIVNTSVE